jgi:hypothetical protein
MRGRTCLIALTAAKITALTSKISTRRCACSLGLPPIADTAIPPTTMPIAMPRQSARRLSSLAGTPGRGVSGRGASAIRTSTRAAISSSTRFRKDATTASLYSGPSSS